jgi:hypothetical protein
MYFR